jgi:hypothetical protein
MNKNMFHVKRGRAFRALGLMALLFAGAPALAQVNRCTAADGKVSFSDRPCAENQQGGALRGLPGVTVPPPGRDASALARESAAARISAAQSPECRGLSERIRGYTLEGVERISEYLVRNTVDRYERECAEQAREAVVAENSRKEAEQIRQYIVQQECATKRRVLQERRPKQASLSESDRRAFTAVAAEVARDCS